MQRHKSTGTAKGAAEKPSACHVTINNSSAAAGHTK